MRRVHTALLLGPIWAVACAGDPARHTLADLRHVEPDLQEVQLQDGLERAMQAFDDLHCAELVPGLS